MNRSCNYTGSICRSILCPGDCRHQRCSGDANLPKSSCSGKRSRDVVGSSCSGRRREKAARAAGVALLNLKQLDDGGDIRAVPLIYANTGRHCRSLCLEADRPYTIGRSARNSQFVFNDSRVSKQHCQILFDASRCKIYLLHGSLSFSGASEITNDGGYIVQEFRSRLPPFSYSDETEEQAERRTTVSAPVVCFRPSLNGLFVNGVQLGKGSATELMHGDEVMLVCASKLGICNSIQIGFVIRNFVLEEAIVSGCDVDHGIPPDGGHGFLSISRGKENKRIFALKGNDSNVHRLTCNGLVERACTYLTLCRCILQSDDPISYIRQCTASHFQGDDTNAFKSGRGFLDSSPDHNVEGLQNGDLQAECVLSAFKQQTLSCGTSQINLDNERIKTANEDDRPSVSLLNSDAKRNPQLSPEKCWNQSLPPPGKKFYLNRLGSMDCELSGQSSVVSLPELLYPVGSISQIFIATFTSDILWFLSYCEIPCDLPVAVACHDTERCWSGDSGKRFAAPYPDFPNVVVVYPSFPEAIAFGKDRRKQGIACHHPKLLVLQREESIRVIVTSANLVEKQWKSVTNTIWWQDFPRASSPEYSSLFSQIDVRDINKNSSSDFAAQLAGFMASLLIDVPSQAHWIVQLTKYDFGGAMGYLIASVPGIHSYRVSSIAETVQLLSDNHHQSCSSGVNFLGSAEASVVGLSHLFRTADRGGAQLKKLAAFLSKSSKNGYGMSEIVLRRSKNVPADVNAVAILVADPKKFPEGDHVQLGFLPRVVAKWVSPLWDIGIFSFSGYVYCQEALAAALGGNGLKVRLILRVLQGPNFEDISKVMQPEHATAFCSLIASLHRCTGLWRLEQVLNQYKWPEPLESDFIYSSSSIGSLLNAKFLATFSSATGKRSLQSFDSEESDPEWGCWNASQESKNPSIRIIFPTIERVRNAHNGILPSKRMLCLSEKTWERMKAVDIFHDAIPHPCDRVGHPMHVKVARRRFESKMGGSSAGWVYCGSHNFSAAAWGRSVSDARLHICNYELGILFVFPPCDIDEDLVLDDVVMPFVVPAPKYGSQDQPATKQAMRRALAQEMEQMDAAKEAEEMMEEVQDDEEEALEAAEVMEGEGEGEKEKEEEKAYAEVLWSQVES